jgi:hypothetical protein
MPLNLMHDVGFFLPAPLDEFAQLGEFCAELLLKVWGEVFGLTGKNELHETASLELLTNPPRETGSVCFEGLVTLAGGRGSENRSF